MHRRLLGLSHVAGQRSSPVAFRSLLALRPALAASRPGSSSSRTFASSLRRVNAAGKSPDPSSSTPSASSSTTQPSPEPTASEDIVSADRTDVDPLKSDSSAAPAFPQPTASEETVAAEKSDVDPLEKVHTVVTKSEQVFVEPTASEVTVAAEKSEVDPLASVKKTTLEKVEVTVEPTASEETVAAEKSLVDPLASSTPELLPEQLKAALGPTESEEDVAADRSPIDPLVVSKIEKDETKAHVNPTESEEDVAADRSKHDPLPRSKPPPAQPAPTTPGPEQRNLRTDPSALLVREYNDLSSPVVRPADDPLQTGFSSSAAQSSPISGEFDPTFLSSPTSDATPYTVREAKPVYGTANNAAYTHLPPISYFAVWPRAAARPLAREILDGATRLELSGDFRRRVRDALDRLVFSPVASDLSGALRNPDGQKMLRVVLLHRHDTYFAPENHVIRKIWDKYGSMAARKESPEFEIEFDFMVWDDRSTVMAVKDVKLILPETEPSTTTTEGEGSASVGPTTSTLLSDSKDVRFWSLPANTQGRFFMEISNATRDTTYPIDLFGDFMKTVGSVTSKDDLPEFGLWGRNDLGSWLKLDGLKLRGQFRGRVWDYDDGQNF